MYVMGLVNRRGRVAEDAPPLRSAPVLRGGRSLPVAVISIALVTGLWLYSCFYVLIAEYAYHAIGFGDNQFSLVCFRGMLRFHVCPGPWSPTVGGRPTEYRWSMQQFPAAMFDKYYPFPWRSLGFLFTHGTFMGRRYVSFALPLWPIWGAGAATMASAWDRRRSRPPHPVCRVCGYDLRATPDRCPECGSAAPPSPPAG